MQRGFSLVFIVMGILVIMVIFFVPLPGYRSMEVCLESNPPICYAKGWYLKMPLYQKLFFAEQTVQQYILPKPAQNISPTPDPTANWKTYTDQENNFSFKYPSDWNTDSSYKSVNSSIHFFKAGDKHLYTYMQAKGNEQLIVSLQVNQSLDEIQKRLNINDSSTTVAGKKALRFATGVYVLLGPSNNKILSVYIPQYPSNGIFDQILSTFKFIPD